MRATFAINGQEIAIQGCLKQMSAVACEDWSKYVGALHDLNMWKEKVLAFLVFFSWLNIFKYLQLIESVGVLRRMVDEMYTDLFDFMMLAMVWVISFATYFCESSRRLPMPMRVCLCCADIDLGNHNPHFRHCEYSCSGCGCDVVCLVVVESLISSLQAQMVHGQLI